MPMICPFKSLAALENLVRLSSLSLSLFFSFVSGKYVGKSITTIHLSTGPCISAWSSVQYSRGKTELASGGTCRAQLHQPT